MRCQRSARVFPSLVYIREPQRLGQPLVRTPPLAGACQHFLYGKVARRSRNLGVTALKCQCDTADILCHPSPLLLLGVWTRPFLCLMLVSKGRALPLNHMRIGAR
jgi:hypothetical protein